MKKKITVLLFLMINQSWTFNFWPGGSGPCNTTLQECIEGVPVSEFIEIRTNVLINSKRIKDALDNLKKLIEQHD